MPSFLVPDMLALLDTLVLLDWDTLVLLEDMLEQLLTPLELLLPQLLPMLPELLLPMPLSLLPPMLLPQLLLPPLLLPMLLLPWPQSTTPSTSPSPMSMLTPRPPTSSALTSSTTLPKLVLSSPLAPLLLKLLKLLSLLKNGQKRTNEDLLT